MVPTYTSGHMWRIERYGILTCSALWFSFVFVYHFSFSKLILYSSKAETIVCVSTQNTKLLVVWLFHMSVQEKSQLQALIMSCVIMQGDCCYHTLLAVHHYSFRSFLHPMQVCRLLVSFLRSLFILLLFIPRLLLPRSFLFVLFLPFHVFSCCCFPLQFPLAREQRCLQFSIFHDSSPPYLHC